MGDELELDAEGSYLDDALSAPGVQSKEPGAPSTVSHFQIITGAYDSQIWFLEITNL